MGISFFNGHVESRCRLTEFPDPKTRIWEADKSNKLPCGSLSCPSHTYCGNPSDYDLPFNSHEAEAEELLFGYSIFNNIGYALFSVYNFLMVTGWI